MTVAMERGRSQHRSSPTQPLRDEHAALRPAIERLRTLADAIGDLSPEALRQGVDAAYDFLAQHLVPHAIVEDEVIYPEVARVMGAPAATATMTQEHRGIDRFTQELGAWRDRLARGTIDHDAEVALRRLLYGVYTLVTVHLGNEEAVFLPLLDAKLTPTEAAQLFEKADAAAEELAAHTPHAHTGHT